MSDVLLGIQFRPAMDFGGLTIALHKRIACAEFSGDPCLFFTRTLDWFS
jgi:hypothetical protein